MIVGGAVLVGLGKAEARRCCENREQSGQRFRRQRTSDRLQEACTEPWETLMRLVTRCLLLTTLMTAACSGSNTTAPSTSSGTFTQTDLVVGTGAEAVTGKTATVTYSGWLYDTNQA